MRARTKPHRREGTRIIVLSIAEIGQEPEGLEIKRAEINARLTWDDDQITDPIKPATI